MGEAGYIDPPFVPNKYDVHAPSLKDIGDFDRAKYRHVKLDDNFKKQLKNFEFISVNALQEEMVTVLEKCVLPVGKYHKQYDNMIADHPHSDNQPICCSIL